MTLLYAGIFALSCVAAYIIFSVMVTSVLMERTDDELMEEVEEFALILADQGIDTAKQEIVLEGKEEDPEEVFFRLLTAQATEIIATDMSSWNAAQVNQAVFELFADGERYYFETITLPDDRDKARILYAAIGNDTVIQVGMSLEDDVEAIKLFQMLFLIALGVLVVFVPSAGWLISRHALKGVKEVTATALNIAKGEFDQRVPPKARGEEVERLAKAFNYMLDRINALMTGIKNMTDNIAHDLRSPIARIRGLAETTLVSDISAEECKSTLANTIEDCDRLLELINTMLDISEAEAGAEKLDKRPIDIAEVVETACELFQPIADTKKVKMAARVARPSPISGDLQKIQRMVANLLDNALKYTPPEGTVSVSVTGDNGHIVSSFSDTGIGISETDLPHIFRRFYRCDESRSQAGVGLGLSLAQAIAKSHGGDIAVTSHPGKGSTFKIILPRAAEA